MKQLFLAVGAIWLSLLSLVGCGGKSPPSPASSSWSTVTLDNLSIPVPPTLQASSTPQYHSVQLFTPAAPSGTDRPQITVKIDSNPSNLSLAQYYSGNPGVNLIGEVAPGTYTAITVQRKTAYRFDLLEVPAIIVIIPVGDHFIDVTDAGDGYQSSGEFQQVLDHLPLGG